jgi:hypothetical protein
MRTYTAHSYRGLALFVGLFTLALFFDGFSAQNAEAGYASFGYQYICSPGDPCPRATTVGTSVRTDKDVYSPGETIRISVVVASDDAPQGNGDVTVRYGVGGFQNVTTLDLASWQFPLGEEYPVGTLTAPSTAGPFNVQTVVNVNSYSLLPPATQYPKLIPLTVLAPAVPPSTANLTVNGASSITVTEGQTLNYNWSSTNGSSYSSTYSTSPACGGSGTWVGGNSASGARSDVADIPAGQTQCVYVITYNVTGSGGNSSDSITVTINTGAPAPVNCT